MILGDFLSVDEGIYGWFCEKLLIVGSDCKSIINEEWCIVEYMWCKIMLEWL